MIRDRLWFFSGYQHLRDSDSQPGTDPDLPRKYEQDKILAKLTWRLAPAWQLVQSFHDELWSSPETPSPTKPLRCDPASRCVGAGDESRSSDAHGVGQHRVGRARGMVPLHSGHFADVGRSEHREPHRPTRDHLERRPAANRRGAACSHDGQGDAQPLSGRVVRCGSRVENRRGKSTGASIARRPSFRPLRALFTRMESCRSARCMTNPPIREAGSSRPRRS